MVVVAFGEVTFGISLLLFVLMLMLELVFVLSLLGFVFVVVLKLDCRPRRPETRRKRRIRDKINGISLNIRGSLGFGVRGGGVFGALRFRGVGKGGVDSPINPLKLHPYLFP